METWIPEVYWILGSLLAAASLASLIGYALRRGRPAHPDVENLNARIRSWWVMILLGGGALLAGRVAIILLFALISFVSMREFLAQSPVRPMERSLLFVCFILALAQYVLIAIGSYELFSILIPAFGFPALAVVSAMFIDTQHFLDRFAAAQCGLMLCAYCLSYIPALMTLRIPGYECRTPLLIVFVVLVAQVSDILQYVWGKLIGRRPIAPAISPSKTVEGFLGGVLCATALGALLQPITPFTAWQAGLMAFMIAIIGFLGGLPMSAIKRDRGIKDWSQLIEGHGGMLDRIDSLCFSAPVFFHLTRHFFN